MTPPTMQLVLWPPGVLLSSIGQSNQETPLRQRRAPGCHHRSAAGTHRMSAIGCILGHHVQHALPGMVALIYGWVSLSAGAALLLLAQCISVPAVSVSAATALLGGCVLLALGTYLLRRRCYRASVDSGTCLTAKHGVTTRLRTPASSTARMRLSHWYGAAMERQTGPSLTAQDRPDSGRRPRTDAGADRTAALQWHRPPVSLPGPAGHGPAAPVDPPAASAVDPYTAR